MKTIAKTAVGIMVVAFVAVAVAAIFGGVISALDMAVGIPNGYQPVLTDNMCAVINFTLYYGAWTFGASTVLAIIFGIAASVCEPKVASVN